MESIEKFTYALSQVSDFVITDTAREQANTLVKDGNPYFAALLRELANRVERNKPLVTVPSDVVMDVAPTVVTFEEGTPLY